MSIDMTVQPQTWAQAFQAPRMTAAEAYAARDAEVLEQEHQAQAAEDARHEHCDTFHHGSCATDTFQRSEIARLQAELARMTADRDRLHMLVHHNDIERQTFARRRAALPAELRRQDDEALHTTTTAHAA
ncbi:hypothetical protein ACIPY5_19775 [Microbacterium sp. NPDC089698]|uniref:hypothetical protein n=1 Tax=Microbacterium sp. NPDC089698 TaxID=3364200 RepID=UPI003811A84E